MNNVADLTKPIFSAHPGKPPAMIRTVISAQQYMMQGAIPSNSQKVEDYVLLNALPEELRQRVLLALQVLSSGF